MSASGMGTWHGTYATLTILLVCLILRTRLRHPYREYGLCNDILETKARFWLELGL